MEMGIGEIVALIGVCIIAVGLFATWRKNGNAQAARDIARAEKEATFQQEIKSNVEHIEEELKSEDHGLVALVTSISDFKINFTEKHTRLEGKVETNTKNIDELKKSKRKR